MDRRAVRVNYARVPDVIALYAQAAPASSIRLWVGIRSALAAPAMQFTLNGVAATPTVVRPMAPAHQAPCAFTGVFAFTGLQPNRQYTILARLGTASKALQTTTLPASLNLNEKFRILLASCYHRDEDKRAALRVLQGQLVGAFRPNLVLLLGDQVYLDLPTFKDFPSDELSLNKIFEANYVTNYFDSNLTVPLTLAPVVSCPDDHEYWNNYPDAATLISNSWNAQGRTNWTNAAARMYRAFQLQGGAVYGRGVRVDVSPLSMYVMDMRSTRSSGATRLFDTPTYDHVKAWVDSLTADKVGVLATGQPLLDTPVSNASGKVFDWAAANYKEDYKKLVQLVHRAATTCKSFFLVTGDVHWGRTTRVHASNGTLLHEVIASPTALVTNQATDIIGSIGAWFTGDKYPRHSAPPDPAAYFAQSVLEKRYSSQAVAKQEGDHVAVLEFTRMGTGCSARVIYHSLEVPPASTTTELRLQRS